MPRAMVSSEPQHSHRALTAHHSPLTSHHSLPSLPVVECPNKCSGHGTCHNGTCTCLPGYYGEDCSRLACPNRCSSHGICNAGACVCYAGWMGEACNLKACAHDCNNRGYCLNGTCECAPPWTGPDCSVQPCPNQCSNRGVCRNDKCYCPAGYTGDACQTRVLSAKWARTSRYGSDAALQMPPLDDTQPIENIEPTTGLNEGPSTRHKPGIASAVEEYSKLGRTAFLQLAQHPSASSFLQMGMFGSRRPPAKPENAHDGLEGSDEE